MKKIIMLFFIMLLTACTMKDQDQKNSFTNEPLHSAVTSSPPPSNSFNKETVEPSSNTTWEDEMENTKEQRRRKGNIDLKSTEVVGLKGELLDTIKQIFEAINKDDEKARLQLMYDPINFDEFGSDGPYILAIPKLELDNSRRDAIAEEYELDKIAEEVAIVKITRKTLTTKLEDSLSTGDYIFIKTKANKKWKLYRLQ